jgi:hypothetical protein
MPARRHVKTANRGRFLSRNNLGCSSFIQESVGASLLTPRFIEISVENNDAQNDLPECSASLRTGLSRQQAGALVDSQAI